MKIYESGENYLETILLIKEKKGKVRAVDIIEELGYTKSSVSRAVNILRDKEYIIIDKNGSITFTPKGRETANCLYERHKVLTECLIRLGVEKSIAEKDACRIEHIISKESFQAIKNHVEKK